MTNELASLSTDNLIAGAGIAGRLFCGVFPEGFSWADRAKQERGDYKKVAFLSFRDLKFTVYDPKSPLLETVKREAAKLQARRGERFETSASGQGVTLGYGLPQ